MGLLVEAIPLPHPSSCRHFTELQWEAAQGAREGEWRALGVT